MSTTEPNAAFDYDKRVADFKAQATGESLWVVQELELTIEQVRREQELSHKRYLQLRALPPRASIEVHELHDHDTGNPFYWITVNNKPLLWSDNPANAEEIANALHEALNNNSAQAQVRPEIDEIKRALDSADVPGTATLQRVRDLIEARESLHRLLERGSHGGITI